MAMATEKRRGGAEASAEVFAWKTATKMIADARAAEQAGRDADALQLLHMTHNRAQNLLLAAEHGGATAAEDVADAGGAVGPRPTAVPRRRLVTGSGTIVTGFRTDIL